MLGLYTRLVSAAAIVALTAGVGRGVSSTLQAVDSYGLEGSVIAATIGLIGHGAGVACEPARRRAQGRAHGLHGAHDRGRGAHALHGLRRAHLLFEHREGDVVARILLPHGVHAFRFGFASVRAFALGQVAYFLASTAGWAIGALVAPFYDDPMVRMAVGAVMAFVVVLVLTLLFTDRDIKAILLAPGGRCALGAYAVPGYDRGLMRRLYGGR